MPTFFYNTLIGRVGISEKDGYITNLFFETDKIPSDIEVEETPLLKEGAQQLNRYLTGQIKTFTLNLAPFGTDFMKKVWTCLLEIPYGATVSYKDVAVKIGSPKAFRAVGQANNRNPLPIFIPCHRVIGANGSLVGYGSGLELKQKLLNLEKSFA